MAVKTQLKTEKKSKDLVKIGNLIKAERKKQKVTLAKLSKLAFGNENFATSISLIERGQKKGVEYLTIVKIVRALGFELL